MAAGLASGRRPQAVFVVEGSAAEADGRAASKPGGAAGHGHHAQGRREADHPGDPAGRDGRVPRAAAAAAGGAAVGGAAGRLRRPHRRPRQPGHPDAGGGRLRRRRPAVLARLRRPVRAQGRARQHGRACSRWRSTRSSRWPARWTSSRRCAPTAWPLTAAPTWPPPSWRARRCSASAPSAPASRRRRRSSSTEQLTIRLAPAAAAVESLNAGVAGAIALYEFSRRAGGSPTSGG